MITKQLPYKVKLECGTENVQVKETQLEEGLYQVDVTFEGDTNEKMEPVELKVSIDLENIHALWTPTTGADRALSTFYTKRNMSLSVGAPLMCFYSVDGENGFSVALSDALNPATFGGYVIEETCTFDLNIKMFEGISVKPENAGFSIRLDRRKINAGRVIQDTKAWWETFEAYKAIETPDYAYDPMYSTWYSFHQGVTTENMLEQCKIAKDMGMKAIIVDDGWQTLDGNRGYAYCGDWQVCKEKIPDMREFVHASQAMGVKVLLWYCVSLIGYKSNRWNDFKDMLLNDDYNKQSCGILDPRYKEVRDYIVKTYVDAVKDWDLDGLKLDFVDQFRMYKESKVYDERMDIANLADAVDVLFKTITRELKEAKPDIMIEFRQFYIGPAMCSYGNIFRAVDCPMDPITNRMRVHDVRLMSGRSATHADMIRWNDVDTDESVAVHLWSTVFSVPQISVDLTKLSESHTKVLKNYLAFSENYRDVLYKGKFEVSQMQAGYTEAKSTLNDVCIHALYQRTPVVMDMAQLDKYIIVNVTSTTKLYIDNAGQEEKVQVVVNDIYGNEVSNYEMTLSNGVTAIEVAPKGVCTISKIK